MTRIACGHSTHQGRSLEICLSSPVEEQCYCCFHSYKRLLIILMFFQMKVIIFKCNYSTQISCTILPVKLNAIDELGESALGYVEPCMMQAKCAGSMGTLRAATTLHRHTDKLVEILTNPHTIKTRKGGVSGSKKGTQL